MNRKSVSEQFWLLNFWPHKRNSQSQRWCEHQPWTFDPISKIHNLNGSGNNNNPSKSSHFRVKIPTTLVYQQYFPSRSLSLRGFSVSPLVWKPDRDGCSNPPIDKSRPFHKWKFFFSTSDGGLTWCNIKQLFKQIWNNLLCPTFLHQQPNFFLSEILFYLDLPGVFWRGGEAGEKSWGLIQTLPGRQ
jgi:hypothetical protein